MSAASPADRSTHPVNERLRRRERYRGRFAPSPTGSLHFGSLIAAVGSFLEARSRNGEWLVRIEDIDVLRMAPGAADDILRTLECYGMEWDGPVLYQSRRSEYYQAALAQLTETGLAYPCTCSRREIAEIAAAGADGLIYPGFCRNGGYRAGRPESIRLRIDAAIIDFHDRIQGFCRQDLAAEVGDFIIRRSDGLFAYQLAVVVDDAEQNVTEVVRGRDLLGSTARQIHLQRLLKLPTPDYAHLPIAVDQHGDKLSKQTKALPLNPRHPGPAIVAALRFLNQRPPKALATEPLPEIWRWAVANWRPAQIPAAPSGLCPISFLSSAK